VFKPDVPLIIMRHRELTYQQKAFLLWCWICRENDDRCNLISCRQDCSLNTRTIQWYADYFGIFRSGMSRLWGDLRKRRIIKIESIDTRNEITYVDFTIFC
jgi:hypothetical protein